MNIKEAIVYFKNYIKVKKEVIRDREEEGLIVDSRYTKQLEEMVEAFEMVLAELEKKDKRIRDYEKGIERLKKEIEKERNTNNKRVAEMVIERLGGKATERKVEKC